MFFFLSKTLSYFIRPLSAICISFLSSLFVRNPKWKRRFLYAGLILLFFFSNEFIANEVMRTWEVKVTAFNALNRKYEYGILLCGVAKSETGPKDRVYIGSAADRVNHTLQLYKLGFIRKILISGGSGRLIDIGEKEAQELGSLLQLMGVPETDILLENGSRNTHESAVEVKKILESLTTPDQCLLVTSANHMRRSIACFSKVGWVVEPFSTDFLSHDRKFTLDVLLVPKLEAIVVWQVLIKEWAGYCAYWVVGYL
jgi:uncharacterized SAM-binding protein YcdF (DUF218 family)